ncbi:carboxypeptidase-like regulatory domain-containing protein [Chitinispirillales bacterium ANBcel5]|uniref:carboxypeptidase regulatory-like domain-containing protein n=1 Tax=Cellulosispirillum alkaliphilum TaxID=3039283 RepID=UPI002A538285|nr:carboxypeptidase-like regulatory domain-containing protein [Chitinispirillales bacterium ANBcel5]
MNFSAKTALLLLCTTFMAVAQIASDYVIVEAPVGARAADQVMWVKWSGTTRNPLDQTITAPDSGIIYFDRSPGGGDLSNYRHKINNPWVDTTSNTVWDNVHFDGSPASRGIAFRPTDQEQMSTGLYYGIVAWPMETDTLISNEFQIIIESEDPVNWQSPSGTISSITPVFQWDANPEVPYYHILLSDEPISIDSSSGTINLSGVSVVWQAITPHTQITYGAPDPSGTLTANPPPLSPGQWYTWVVLNNYGNHPALSSSKIKLPPADFTIEGEQLNIPENIYPVDQKLNSSENPTFNFKWSNLDPDANTYQLYVYTSSDSLLPGLGDELSAQIVVWERTVSASGGEDDTMSVSINAASIFTSNNYTWRVMAIDNSGASTAGELSGFSYSSPTGVMNLYTREKVVFGTGESADTMYNSLGLVEIKVDVVDGSMEAPLFFYTDESGRLSRTRPEGRYRVTAVKEGFLDASRTVTVKAGVQTHDTLYMERPPATIYGRVIDEAGASINLATITAVSDMGDTVTAKSNSQGNYILNCYDANWRVSAAKNGYRTSQTRTVDLRVSENKRLDPFVLQKNTYTLSGSVRNSDARPIVGVRVRLLQNGIQIDEQPSTPQDGSYSFSVEPGSYTLTAQKAGFSNYSREITVTGSRVRNITLNPGAVMVSGYIIGRTWSQDRYVYAPIRNASVTFINSDENDTVRVYSDRTYGYYSANLTADREYKVYSAASGFGTVEDPGTVVTAPSSAIEYNDTLMSKALVSGNVRTFYQNQNVRNASITLMDKESNKAVRRGTSQADGYFEILDIPDGKYSVQAGYDGLYLDSVAPLPIIEITEGRAVPAHIELFMKPGDKALTWHLEDFDGDVRIRIRSPLIRNLDRGDTLTGAGHGTYIIEVEPDADSVLGLSYRSFTVPETATTHTDTVKLPVIHNSPSSVEPLDGKVSLMIKSVEKLDSARLFYRSRGESMYRMIEKSDTSFEYNFTFSPRKNGTDLFYYFKAYRDGDVYGGERATFTTFVTADTSRLSRFEIVPSSEDPIPLPSGYSVTVSVKGYYSSAFIEDENIRSDAISWRLENAQGCRIDATRGEQIHLTTPGNRITSPVTLYAEIDTAKVRLAPDVGRIDSVKFTVSGSSLSSIAVVRIDASNPNPITTSGIERARFRAVGVDSDGNEVEVNPIWSVVPKESGEIDQEGIFKPSGNFVGFVRVLARSGLITGEYNPVDKNSRRMNAGLNVRYVLASNSYYDTVTTGRGCKILFPPDITGGTENGLLQVSIPNTRNQMKRGAGNLRMVDTVAYEITELRGTPFNLSEDSIKIFLQIPEGLRSEAIRGKRDFWVARWDQDSLQWNTLSNSTVEDEGEYVSAKVANFSQFALVSEPRTLSANLKVSPNPFSPYIKPVNEFGHDAPKGTCIMFRIDAPDQRVASAKVHIYNNVGERVWAVELLNASTGKHRVWWNGRTTSRLEVWNSDVFPYGGIPQGRMLRNGRYFVVLTVKDMSGNKVQYMNPVILMK